MSDEMKINLYEVGNHSDIKKVLNEIKGVPLKDRVRLVNSYDMKLEEIETETYEGVEIYLMDFSKHRMAGPGRSAPDKATKSFSLAQNEGFGEMVAALYAPLRRNAYILIQYNHYSCRSGSIAKYLNEMGSINCFFDPSINDEILEKMNSTRFGKSFDFSFATEFLAPKHKRHLGIGQALDILENTANNVGLLDITIKKGKERKKKLSNYLPILKKMLWVHEDEPRAVTKLTLDASTDIDTPSEILDLLKAKEYKTYKGLKLDMGTRRYPFNDRCEGLKSAFRDWKRDRKIR